MVAKPIAKRDTSSSCRMMLGSQIPLALSYDVGESALSYDVGESTAFKNDTMKS